jgi:hypothetical protein
MLARQAVYQARLTLEGPPPAAYPPPPPWQDDALRAFIDA